MAKDPQYEKLRERLYALNKWSLRPAAMALAFFGVLVLLAWYLTNDGSTMSMLLMLAGISMIVLSFMLYFLSPARYLRSEVSDAFAHSDIMNIGRMLSSLFIESKGIYVPSGDARLLQVFIPIKSGAVVDLGVIKPGNDTFNVSGSGVKGISLIPPGYGLFRYAQGIGAVFTQEGLENEIKDVLQNGLELASSVDVRAEGSNIVVSMSDIANSGLCATIRKDDPRICEQLGCPLCSMVGCMIVSATGRPARIGSTKVLNNAVTVTYELL